MRAHLLCDVLLQCQVFAERAMLLCMGADWTKG